MKKFPGMSDIILWRMDDRDSIVLAAHLLLLDY